MAEFKAPRSVVLVHGVQWEMDFELRGYSRPLTDLVRSQAPSVTFDFHEVLWSNVVEQVERDLISAGKAVIDLLTGNVGDAIFELARLIASKSDFQFASRDELFGKPVQEWMAPELGFAGKAMSAVLDLVYYFATDYGEKIRAKVRETLNSLPNEEPPVLFGHSLGSVILLDIIREDISANRLHVGGLITAGSPLGLFQPGNSHSDFGKFDWINLYDMDDLVGPWNPLRRKGYPTVLDQRIDTHEFPFYSHVKYWTNSVVARELVDLALTM